MTQPKTKRGRKVGAKIDAKRTALLVFAQWLARLDNDSKVDAEWTDTVLIFRDSPKKPLTKKR